MAARHHACLKRHRFCTHATAGRLPRGAMRRAVPTSLLLLVLIQQACQYNEATAPQSARPGGVSIQDRTAPRIAFTSNRDGNDEIYVMNADGSAPTRLTTTVAHQPRWSPDGQRIAFTSGRGCDTGLCIGDIYVMAADGSAPVRLTSVGATDPSW